MVHVSTRIHVVVAGCLAVGLAFGCSSRDGDVPAAPSEPPAAPVADPTPTSTPSQPAAASWDSYWTEFQRAAAAKDKEALRKLSHLGGELDEEGLEMLVSSFLSAEVLAFIGKTGAAAVEVREGTAGGDDEVRELMWYEEREDDGVTTESSLTFRFARVDGTYKLVAVHAAG